MTKPDSYSDEQVETALTAWYGDSWPWHEGAAADQARAEMRKALAGAGVPVQPYSFAAYAMARLGEQREITSPENRMSLAALGLAGEAGEYIELIKKHLFHGKDLDREKAVKELGDVLWYVMFAADSIGSSLDEVARVNDAKLRERYPNGFSVEAARTRRSEP